MCLRASPTSRRDEIDRRRRVQSGRRPHDWDDLLPSARSEPLERGGYWSFAPDGRSLIGVPRIDGEYRIVLRAGDPGAAATVLDVRLPRSQEFMYELGCTCTTLRRAESGRSWSRPSTCRRTLRGSRVVTLLPHFRIPTFGVSRHLRAVRRRAPAAHLAPYTRGHRQRRAKGPPRGGRPTAPPSIPDDSPPAPGLCGRPVQECGPGGSDERTPSGRAEWGRARAEHTGQTSVHDDPAGSRGCRPPRPPPLARSHGPAPRVRAVRSAFDPRPRPPRCVLGERPATPGRERLRVSDPPPIERASARHHRLRSPGQRPPRSGSDSACQGA